MHNDSFAGAKLQKSANITKRGFNFFGWRGKLSVYFTFSVSHEEKRYFSHRKVPLFAW